MKCSHRYALIPLLLVGVAAPAEGQATEDSRVRIERASAGTMQTNLGYGVVLNERSTLPREAITIHDATLPVTLPPTVSVATKYADRSYRYSAAFSIIPSDTLTAIEIRILVFDVFGERLRTLSLTEVADMLPGTSYRLQPEWNLNSENEASEYYGSIAFVARVRTRAGRVLSADLKPVLAEAQRFNRKFAMGDLEAEAPPRR